MRLLRVGNVNAAVKRIIGIDFLKGDRGKNCVKSGILGQKERFQKNI